jgi:hypothetical protein
MQNRVSAGEGERRVFWCAVLLAAWWIAVIAPSAEAYIDPSAGGMLVQLLLAGTAGVAVLGKLFWSRIRRMFGGVDAESSAKPAQSDSDHTHDRV